MSTPTQSATAATVPTFNRYVEDEVRRLAAKYGLPLSEVREEVSMSALAREWRNHVVAAYDEGAHIRTALLRTFDEGLMYRLARTTRALRSAEETHDLITRYGAPFLAR